MKKLVLLAATSAIAVLTFAVGVSWADHGVDSYNGTAESHAVIAGNPDCPFGTSGFKIDSVPANGVHGGLVEVTNSDGTYFDWALVPDALHVVDMGAVIVKGGPNAAVFIYDYAGGGQDDSDVGLSAPWNKKAPYGVSHVSFCFDPKGGGDD
jgi:hypothetical protein